MTDQILQFAVTEASSEGSQSIFQALGLDIRLLIVQILAFLIVFLILKKFVFPPLTKALDDRQEKIEASVKAAEQAMKSAEKAEENTEKQLEAAKKEAADIVALAQKESSSIVEQAEKRAEKRADHIVASAEARLAQDVSDAREALKADMIDLVAKATETVLRAKVDDKADKALIKKAIEEAK